MESRDIVLQPVGWNGERFVTEEVLIEHEDSSMLKGDNVLFERGDVLLREIALYMGKDNIVGLEATLTSGRKSQFGFIPAQPSPEIKFHKFVFQSEEAVTKLDLYYNFSGLAANKEASYLSAGRSGDVESGAAKSQTQATPESDPAGEATSKEFELSLLAARCCGIDFTTSKGRRFKAMSWRTLGFQTRCEVNVASGFCCGILTSVSNNISLFGLLFLKELDSPDANGESNQAPMIGPSKFKQDSSARKGVLPFVCRIIRGWNLFVLRFISISVLAALVTLRMLIFQLVLPLYDIVSDGMASYVYFKEQIDEVGFLIAIFIFMPHMIQSLSLIFEMIIEHGEFDEYPKAIVRFYRSTLSPKAIISNIIKFATSPLFMFLNFLWFIGTLFQNGWVLIQELLFVARFVAREGKRHVDDLREKNVKQDSWSKVIFSEIVFESFPQFIVQITALFNFSSSNDAIKTYPIFASISVSAIMLLRQAWIFTRFMLKTSLSFVNSVRIVFSSALDFFPIFSLYSNTIRHALFRFYNNPVMMELWGPLCKIMKEVSSLKAITLYLEHGQVWFDMSMQMLDAISANEYISLEMLDICVEDNTELVVSKREDLKKRMYSLLTTKKVEKIYLLIHCGADLGIMEESVEETTKEEVIENGIRWTWKWPGGRTARVEYCLEHVA
eukprot:g4902.t1